MFNPLEYVGRVERSIMQKLRRPIQKIEIHNYMKNPPIYTISSILMLIDEYSPDSRRCQSCINYLICDRVVNKLKAGEVREIELEPTFSMK